MIIQPKIRGFICTTAHPVGCARNVAEQVEYVQSQPAFDGPKKVLVIGSSTGYGLASRIAVTFGSGADTIGICFEKPSSETRTGTAGWYNTAAFEQMARDAGRYAHTINGDAFSDEVKQQTIDLIRDQFGKVDLVVYSLASPRRTHPKTGESFSSVIKPVNAPFTSKSIDVNTGKVSEVTIEPATPEEVESTTAVMGGEDWQMWMDALEEADVLANDAIAVAYSYIGPELTRAIYREGTIGKAKDDIERTARALDTRMQSKGGRALISINKALVTQSSSAIPVVPLYISMLYKVMKEQGTHEGCIEQMYRLFASSLYSGRAIPTDSEQRIRLDDREMEPEVQETIANAWTRIDTDTLSQYANIEEYRNEFLRLFGFAVDGVDYEADVNPDVHWPSAGN